MLKEAQDETWHRLYSSVLVRKAFYKAFLVSFCVCRDPDDPLGQKNTVHARGIYTRFVGAEAWRTRSCLFSAFSPNGLCFGTHGFLDLAHLHGLGP